MAILLAAFACALAFVSAAGAATLTVDDPADTATPDTCSVAVSDCTLRGAIAKANIDSAPDVIDFDDSISSLTIGNALPPVTNPLTIDGGGDVSIVGNGSYASGCQPDQHAIDTTASQVQILSLAIHSVCGRAIKSSLAAPTIQIGPRRADDTVSINGSAPSGAVDIFRADDPASSGEGLELFDNAVPAAGGGYSRLLSPLPSQSEFFSAIATSGGVTSTFSQRVKRPADLTSPKLIYAVGVTNNIIRLDFDEPLSPAIGGVTAGFSLNMGGVARPVTNVDVSGNSILIASYPVSWGTGEAGTVALTGNGRVTDLVGNEALGAPSQFVFSGPGELGMPEITMLKAAPSKFCRVKTRRCTKRVQTYLKIRVTKPSRVVFRVLTASKRKYVLRWTRKLPVGTTQVRMLGSMSGRTMPAGWLIVQAVAEDYARNFSAPVEAKFKTLTRNGQF